MTPADLSSIRESIERIEKFSVGYPKLITDVDETWKAYFQWGFDLCVSRAKALSTVHEEKMNQEVLLL